MAETVRIMAAVFDFDGTISTLRYGWERLMRGLMVELLSPDVPEAEIDAYIDESTGIQTIFQMKWLAERVRETGRDALDPWAYKDEYNRRLMCEVMKKRRALEEGRRAKADFMVSGTEAFLRALHARGVTMYLASGTDEADVRAEARALGVDGYFARIAGAPPREEKCSKEAVIRALLAGAQTPPKSILVVGDGKVEIALGKSAGARTLGVASDEAARRGINPDKRARLVRAGADKITGDFLALDALVRWVFAEAEGAGS